MAKVASLWIGDSLGVVERMCINSFLNNGDEFILFVYGKVSNVPSGVEVVDANEILKTKNIVRHLDSGSPALHSDIFRYALILKTEYIWVDLDIMPLKSFEFSSDWIFGYESKGVINGAVLKLPKNSKALENLSRINVDTKGYPPHLDFFSIASIKYIIKVLMNGSTHISNWPWGSIGPLGLTYFLKQSNEDVHALPINSFYPVSFENVAMLLSPGAVKLEQFSEETYAVHLWGKELRKILDEKYSGKVPKGCFLENYL